MPKAEAVRFVRGDPRVQCVQWHMPFLLTGGDRRPARDRPVDRGTTLYYVARQRIDASSLAAGG